MQILVATAAPTPNLTPQSPSPVPAPSFASTVLQPTADAVAWSADTTVALIGVIVAGLGAIATGLLAWLALRQTQKAAKLEVEARDRAGRLAAATAIESFLSGWTSAGDVTAWTVDAGDARALRLAAAGASPEGRELAEWVIGELQRTAKLFLEEHESWDPNAAMGVMSMTMPASAGLIRERLLAWVATGEMNREAVYRPAPRP